MDERLHIFGIRHHGPGSAALLVRALDAVQPECVLIEGPPEADELILFAQYPGMQPPIALLVHATSDANAAFFFPLAEFSPEWQAMLWASKRGVPVRFIDSPAGIHVHTLIAQKNDPEQMEVEQEHTPDPLDELAAAAGYGDGEAFWNSLIEQGRLSSSAPGGKQALQVFAGIENAMTAVRAEAPQRSERDALRELHREAWMRIHIRQALKEHAGKIAAIVGAWHTSALRAKASASGDKALVRDLPRERVDATWVPWTDSRLAAASGYGAGVISPGWYSHLWRLYESGTSTTSQEFAAQWQAKTAALLRSEGYFTPTASAIEAARLSLALASMRARAVPSLAEMREAALATLCHGDELPLRIIDRKLYVGERVGEIDSAVPQMPLARDLALWQKKTRLKPEDIDTEQRVDLRSEAGLLKSTLLHRLLILKVSWGRLVEADAGRGTFREVWRLRWAPELSVALAEALVYGGTIEQAAANAQLDRAAKTNSISELAQMVRETLVADLPDAAAACIERLQAAAVQAAEITELMEAVPPLVRVLRYGTARKLPEEQLRALVHALSVEVNASVRSASHNLDDEAAATRVQAMLAFDEALRLFADSTLIGQWQSHLCGMVDDPQVAAAIAGLSLRRLHESGTWTADDVEAAFSRHMIGEIPQRAGPFLENFLRGGSEVLMQDEPLLHLIDAWLCGLVESDFVESLPLLRRSFSEFDTVARRRVLERIARGRRERGEAPASLNESEAAFAQALPLLCQILGLDFEGGTA
jgi:hypothetical protein